MLVSSHSAWPPTGHNDLNVDDQPNLQKASPLRESKFILVGDNVANIRLCMTNDNPTHTLLPILGTASAHLARGNRYHATCSCENCQHTTLLVYQPPTLSTHSYKHGITNSGSAALMTCHAIYMPFPTTILQQT